jgi:AcrR family transcriptional regulator
VTDHQSEQQWLDELMKLNASDHKMTDKQVRIIEAAVEIFSTKGYSASSTSEIAQKAGVAEGTIFRHYKTKKDLLLSIVGPIMTKMIAPLFMRDFLKKVFHTNYEKIEDFLRAIIINRMDFARKNLPIIKIMLNEIPFHPELKKQFMNDIASKVMEEVSVIIAHYQHKGQIIELPPITIIRLCVSTIMGFLLSRYMFFPELNWDDEQEINVTIDFIMNGISAVNRK